MIFLDPKSDIAFKKLFSEIKHKDILISFLNSILKRKEDSKIVDVSIADPYNHKERPGSKLSIVDARCTDKQGKHYILEIQVTDEKDYKERCLYYAALALNRQLDHADEYKKIEPVIFIGILDFNLFSSPSCVKKFLLLDPETGEHGLPDLEFHFIELQKFDKELTDVDDIKDIVDKWIYLLKYASKLQTIPASFKDAKAVVHAFEVLEQGSWSKKELIDYDRFIDAMRQEKSRLETAEEKGELRGEQRKARAIAQQLLDVLDIATIAKKTGLSVQEVEALKK